MTTCADLQALIDAKVILIGTLITTLTTIISTPKPSYNIDGQEVLWGDYLRNLTQSQKIELDSLNLLYDLQMRVCPYQFQSTANTGGYGVTNGGWYL